MMTRKQNLLDDSNHALKSIIDDLINANPEIPNIVLIENLKSFVSESFILEYLPIILRRIGLSSEQSPSPFRSKIKYFQNRRSRKTGKESRENSSEENTRQIISEAKEYFDQLSAVNISSTYNMTLEKFNTKDLKSNTNVWIKTESGIQTTGGICNGGLYNNSVDSLQIQLSKGSPKEDSDVEIQDNLENENILFDIESQLVEHRDNSMARGRFLSIVEIASRNFAINKRIPLTFHLSMKEGNRESMIESIAIVLKIKTNRYVSNDVGKDLETKLYIIIRDKLFESLNKLTEPERNEFQQLIPGFSVEILNQKDIIKADLSRLISFRKIQRGNNLEFDDLTEIKLILEESNERSILEEILQLLRDDVRIRKEKYGIAPVDLLYADQAILPTGLHLKRPQLTDTKGLIKEALRAIALVEYSKLCSVESINFLNNKIRYDDYLSKTENYSKVATDLW
jgi:hypothetical protein